MLRVVLQVLGKPDPAAAATHCYVYCRLPPGDGGFFKGDADRTPLGLLKTALGKVAHVREYSTQQELDGMVSFQHAYVQFPNVWLQLFNDWAGVVEAAGQQPHSSCGPPAGPPATAAQLDCRHTLNELCRSVLPSSSERLHEHGDAACALLVGVAGGGKSIVLRSWVGALRSQVPAEVPVRMVECSGSLAASTSSDVLWHLCHGLQARATKQQRRGAEGLAALLYDCGAAVMVLDGVDKLDGGSRLCEVEWLPQHLPPGVMLVLSVDEMPGQQVLSKLRSKAALHVVEVS